MSLLKISFIYIGRIELLSHRHMSQPIKSSTVGIFFGATEYDIYWKML